MQRGGERVDADRAAQLVGRQVFEQGVARVQDRVAREPADVRVGDYLEVRGTAVPGEPVLASIVQRSKGEARSSLQGVATDLASPAFKVLGVSVTIDSQTSFPGLSDGTKGADAFFAQAANQLVRVRGTMNGNTLIADQVRIVSQ